MVLHDTPKFFTGPLKGRVVMVGDALGVHGDSPARQELQNCTGSRALKHPAERLMQQRLFQLVQGGELALVEGFEVLGFDSE
ncbi:hypothetical protein UT5_01840 [Ferrigenium sp. UT5]